MLFWLRENLLATTLGLYRMLSQNHSSMSFFSFRSQHSCFFSSTSLSSYSTSTELSYCATLSSLLITDRLLRYFIFVEFLIRKNKIFKISHSMCSSHFLSSTSALRIMLCSMLQAKKETSILFWLWSRMPWCKKRNRPLNIPKQHSTSFLVDSTHSDQSLSSRDEVCFIGSVPLVIFSIT